MHTFCSRTELADFAGLSKARSRAPCKAFRQRLYPASAVPENTCTWICFRQRPRSSQSSPPHKTILMRRAFAGLSEEELICYAKVTERSRENTMRVLGVIAPVRVFRYRNKRQSTNCFLYLPSSIRDEIFPLPYAPRNLL